MIINHEPKKIKPLQKVLPSHRLRTNKQTYPHTIPETQIVQRDYTCQRSKDCGFSRIDKTDQGQEAKKLKGVDEEGRRREKKPENVTWRN